MGTRQRREPEDPTVLPWFGWGDPVRTPGNDEQAFPVARAGGGKAGRDQKSPLRRCFKPRPSWRTRCAGFASGCQSSVRSCKRSQTLASSDFPSSDIASWRSHSGRLSGLLSGCPPTDTRPQARANLGNLEISGFHTTRKTKSRCARKIFADNASKVSRSLIRRRRESRDATRASLDASVARREWLDAHAVAHEVRHHEQPDQKERDLQRVDVVVAEPDQVGGRPAAREGGAKDLGADQDRGAQNS